MVRRILPLEVELSLLRKAIPKDRHRSLGRRRHQLQVLVGVRLSRPGGRRAAPDVDNRLAPDIHAAGRPDLPPLKVRHAAIWVFALLAVALFRIIDSTLDLRIFGHEHVAAVLHSKRPFLVVVWHGRGLLPIFFFQGYPLVVYSSQSRTGRVPTLSRYARKLTLASLRHLGYQVLDASTFHSESRGVIRFLQYLEHGTGGLIAADGPAGPIFRAKPGAVYVGKKTGVDLLPVAAAIRDAIAIDSWDRFEIPRPFTKAVLAIGERLDVPEDIDEDGLARVSEQLETILNDLTARAEVEAFSASH